MQEIEQKSTLFRVFFIKYLEMLESPKELLKKGPANAGPKFFNRELSLY